LKGLSPKVKEGDRRVEDRSSKLDNINDFLDQYPIKVNQDDEAELNILTGGDKIIDDSRVFNDQSDNVLSTRQNDNITKLLSVTKKHDR